MGEGADMGYEDQQSQGGGEYFAPAGTVPAPGVWGPPEGGQVAGTWGPPEGQQYAPAPPQYQHPQPPSEYRPGPSGYAPAPPVQQRMLRRRKVSKGMERMYLVQAFEELLSTPVFNDPSDPYATKVQEELFAWAQRRVDELLGEVPEKGTTAGLTPSEVLFLKALVERMAEPDEPEASPPPQETAPAAPVPTPPPTATPAPRPPQQSVQTPPPRPQAPPTQAPPAPRPPPAGGPHVVTRPTAAQREALAQRRMRPPAAPPQLPPGPPPAPVQQPQYAPAPVRRHMTPPEPAPARRGRRRAQAEAPPAPGPPPKALPPPPMRYAMPLGQGMTAVSAMKAQQQIEAGGTVLSQTFVKSPAMG